MCQTTNGLMTSSFLKLLKSEPMVTKRTLMPQDTKKCHRRHPNSKDSWECSKPRKILKMPEKVEKHQNYPKSRKTQNCLKSQESTEIGHYKLLPRVSRHQLSDKRPPFGFISGPHACHFFIWPSGAAPFPLEKSMFSRKSDLKRYIFPIQNLSEKAIFDKKQQLNFGKITEKKSTQEKNFENN